MLYIDRLVGFKTLIKTDKKKITKELVGFSFYYLLSEIRVSLTIDLHIIAMLTINELFIGVLIKGVLTIDALTIGVTVNLFEKYFFLMSS